MNPLIFDSNMKTMRSNGNDTNYPVEQQNQSLNTQKDSNRFEKSPLKVLRRNSSVPSATDEKER